MRCAFFRACLSLGIILAMMASVLPLPVVAQNVSAISANIEGRERQLQSELDSINQEINNLNNTISVLQGEKASLSRDIKLLTATIDKATLDIKRKNIQIANLTKGINEKSRDISLLEAKIDRERQSLIQLIRKTNEFQQSSLIEVLLSNDSLSEFYADLDAFNALREALKHSTDALRSAKLDAENAKADLEERQVKEIDARAELERSKRIVELNQKEKNRLLSITNNREKEYQKVLSERKKRAAEIRAALFALRDSGEIPFGTALEYANFVSQKTGVRPAFLLAILQQESALGKNQGSCFLKNQKTGEGISVRTGSPVSRVMKPDRDVAPFLKITAAVGRDWQNSRVSCPQEIGYGGAMGPAQFIPSTWILYEDLIKSATGEDITDPWNPRDAFMASGFLLRDNGATRGGYSAERDAACKYFSGRQCSQSSWAATYGTQVMQKATNIQENMIDPLQNT
jgi:membrane-bound lytic murein transglycosylase B